MDKKFDSKEYAKAYYEKHKKEMNERTKELRPDRTKREILKKLNENKYKRTPFEKIKKYDIHFDEEKKLYF